MFAIHEVGAFLVLQLGLAFLLIWLRARNNQTAAYWAAAHLSLAAASLTGFRFQEQGGAGLGLAALLCTGLFLTMMCAANVSMTGARVRLHQVLLSSLLVSAGVGIAGFGIDQFVGRLLVIVLMTLLFAWSAYFFWRRFGMVPVALAFLTKAAALALYMTDGDRLSTAQQSPLLSLINWFATIVLALVLVDLASRLSNNRLVQMLRHMPEAIVAVRNDQTILLCNQRFAELAGAAAPEILAGRKLATLPLKLTAPRLSTLLPRRGAIRNRHLPLVADVSEQLVDAADGVRFAAEVTSSAFVEFGMPVMVLQVRDIGERKSIEAERVRLLSTDQLTGLINRQGLEMQLPLLLTAHAANKRCCSLIAIDIQHFKRVNEAFGTQRGDAILRQVGAGLEQLKGPGDLAARIGSDEFIIVIGNLPGDIARARATQYAHAVQQMTLQIQHDADLTVGLHANIGIALSDEHCLQGASLLSQALRALHEAKNAATGDVMFYSTYMDAHIRKTLQIEAGLRAAIEKQELMLYYQPIVHCATGALEKVEALLRWHSPAIGQVPPGMFIPIAEQSTLILEIGRWVLGEACRQAALWAKMSDRPPVISVNVSAKQFISADFEQSLMAMVTRHQLAPSALDLELTESLFIDQDDQHVLELLQRLAAAGFGLSLDDFGTGYSSLAYLARFPLTAVKIDRSFVSNMNFEQRKRPLVKTIIAMGHNLGLKVIAEGVETEDERRCLQEDGCDLLQGYLLGRPAPASKLFETAPA